MKIIPIVLTIAVFAGCTVRGQSDPQGRPAGSDKESDPSAQRKEIIQKLIGESDVIVLGNVTTIHDATAKDGGMSYDVRIETVFYGKDVPKDALRFRSGGWIGYAKYKKEEHVLLFLKRWQEELLQVHPVCYLMEDANRQGLILLPFQDYLDFIKSEIQNKKSKNKT
ncbi:MAG: hypothetical protein NTY65_08620 [Planctomycetota bacterium]|nr:hypothetical protein [Planctomycetota bacterium]